MLDERELLIEELADGHGMVGAALSDLTAEVAQWQPGGTANSIASLLAHTISGEDRVINQMFKGGESLFDTGGWAAKTGIPAGNDDIWAGDWTLDVAAFDSYRQEVQRSTEAFLADLDPAVLDQDIQAWGSARRGGWMLRVVIGNHILSHLGEISVLRGMKGLAGLPI